MVQTYGIILIAIGIAIRLYIGRRRFYRRGITGMQQFSSYAKALIITLLEGLFHWVANCIILFGIFLIIIG